MSVSDDGRGFDLLDLTPIERPRFGLQTMQERAEAIGATLEVDTAPDRGTRLVLRVPVSGRAT